MPKGSNHSENRYENGLSLEGEDGCIKLLCYLSRGAKYEKANRGSCKVAYTHTERAYRQRVGPSLRDY
jgi:hypothetical protein